MAVKLPPGGQWIPTVCTKADLIVLLGVGSRQVEYYDQKGLVVRGEKPRTYKTLETLHAVLGHLRGQAAGRANEGGLNLSEQRAKQAEVERQLLEIRLAKERGEVMTLQEVDEAWGNFARQVRSSVMSIPSKARQTIPHLTAHDGETIKGICVDTLTQLAEEVEAGIPGADPAAIKRGK